MPNRPSHSVASIIIEKGKKTKSQQNVCEMTIIDLSSIVIRVGDKAQIDIVRADSEPQKAAKYTDVLQQTDKHIRKDTTWRQKHCVPLDKLTCPGTTTLILHLNSQPLERPNSNRKHSLPITERRQKGLATEHEKIFDAISALMKELCSHEDLELHNASQSQGYRIQSYSITGDPSDYLIAITAPAFMYDALAEVGTLVSIPHTSPIHADPQLRTTSKGDLIR